MANSNKFSALPNEILFKICSGLTHNELSNLRLVNRKCNSICLDFQHTKALKIKDCLKRKNTQIKVYDNRSSRW